MSYSVGFDAAARADIRMLYDYIRANGGEKVAREFIEKLLDYCAGFETLAERGILRSDLSPDCGW